MSVVLEHQLDETMLPRCTTVPLRLVTLRAIQRSAALSIWRELEASVPQPRLTSSAAWTEIWLNHFGSQVRHEFLVGYRGADAAGIALVTRGSAKWIRTAHIGTAGERDADSVCVEYNTLLARPCERLEFAQAMHHELVRQKQSDAIAWDGFEPDDFSVSDQNFVWQMFTKPTFYYDLRSVRQSGVEPITRFGDSTRKLIRQNLRDLNEVRIDWSETTTDIDAAFDELIIMHQARWQSAGEPGSFVSPTFCNFHRELLHRLVPQRQAAMVRVRAGTKTIGCTILHIDRNRVLVYQGGWNPGSAKSPGVINDYCTLLECLHRGYDAYDFMAGESLHKRRMTTHQGELIWAVCQLSRFKFAALNQLRAAKRWLHSWRLPFRREVQS